MKRVYKDQKMVGKLSTRKIPFGDPFIHKKVSAVLPAVRNHSKNRLSNSAFLFEGKQDPLPYIKPGVKPLSRKNKNPEENEIFYVDGSKGKIGHCISTQMNSPRHAHAGKLYNPSSQIFASPGKIRHVASSEPKGPHLQKTIKQFKNFLNHSYLQEVQTSRSRINIQEFDYKFRDSAIASSSQFQKQMKQSRYSREMQNQSAYYEQKPFYLSTNSMKTSDITLENQGEFYARSEQSKIDQHIGFTPMPLNLQQNGKDKQGIVVSMQMPVSRIKRMLIEEDYSVQLFFNISKVLMEELSVSILQRQIHGRALSIFEQMMLFKPQIVSLKRFSNCILLIANHPTVNENKTTLLWSYDGDFYIGGWVQSKKSEGSKQGLGLQFLNNAIYFGEFENNRYQGFGILKKASNQIYVGQWSQGEKHGWGKVFDEKGSLCLDGNFQNGSYCGSRTQAK